MGVHFHQSKMFADARARAKAEGKIGKAVPAGDVGREKAVGIEPSQDRASAPGAVARGKEKSGTSVFAGSE